MSLWALALSLWTIVMGNVEVADMRVMRRPRFAVTTTTTLAQSTSYLAAAIAAYPCDTIGATLVASSATTCGGAGTDCNLTLSASPPTLNTTNKVVGAGSCHYVEASDQSTICSDSTCEEMRCSAGSCTIGGWMYTTTDIGRRAIDKVTGNTGYRLARDAANDTITCTIGGGTVPSLQTATAATNSFPITTWEHVMCVFDTAADTIQIYINGATSGSPVTQQSLAGGAADFRLSSNGASLDWNGDLDEAIVTPKAYTTTQVCHDLSCGNGGQLCACSAADATLYATCTTSADCPTAGGAALCDTTAGKCQGLNHATPGGGGCTLPLCNAAAP